MVAERVPGQVAHEAVVLMEVVARVGEDEVRVDAGLQRLEDVLDLGTLVRAGSRRGREDLHRRLAQPGEEASALVRASSIRVAVRREDDPV